MTSANYSLLAYSIHVLLICALTSTKTLQNETFKLPGYETVGERVNTTSPIDDDINKKGSLRMVFLITRHGSRTPYQSYPTDPYPTWDSTYWPDGPKGQLTVAGKQQLYTTGLMLRARYRDFLSPFFNYNETWARANPINRDYMSAGCLLAGLYPPQGYELWNDALLWQPIPIYPTFDQEIFIDDPTFCPRFTYAAQQALNNLDQSRASEFQKTYAILTKYSGKNITNIYDAFLIYDALQMAHENGYTLPNWARLVYPEPISTMAALCLRARFCGTPEIMRIFSSESMNAIVDVLNRKINGSEPNMKMFINAAHEISIIGIFNSLGLTEPFYPHTGSYLVFELHEFTPQNFTVQMLFFNDSTTIAPTALDAPKCSNPCSLSALTQLVRTNFPTNWKEECGL